MRIAPGRSCALSLTLARSPSSLARSLSLISPPKFPHLARLLLRRRHSRPPPPPPISLTAAAHRSFRLRRSRQPHQSGAEMNGDSSGTRDFMLQSDSHASPNRLDPYTDSPYYFTGSGSGSAFQDSVAAKKQIWSLTDRHGRPRPQLRRGWVAGFGELRGSSLIRLARRRHQRRGPPLGRRTWTRRRRIWEPPSLRLARRRLC